MHYRFRHTLFLVLLSHSLSVTAETRASFDNPQLTVRLTARTPQQMAAFYEARGFGKEMLEIIKQQCFITIFIKNKSSNVVWHELAQWKFHNRDGEIQRLDRHYWKQRWQTMQIPLAHQSIFRWTMLPESLDFQPAEREGGNIILPRTAKPFSVTATFSTMPDKYGPAIHMNLNNFECAD